MKLRRVIVTFSARKKKKQESGWFHRWTADGNGVPHAVVEFSDGRVEVVQYINVRFVSPPGTKPEEERGLEDDDE